MANAANSAAASSSLPSTDAAATQSQSNHDSAALPPTSNPTNDDTDLDPQQDRELDTELNTPQPANTDSMNLDNSTSANPPASSSTQATATATATNPLESSTTTLPDLPTVLEPRIPQKKDTSLREFLSKMDDYAPLIPDAVTDYYLTLAGLPPPPETDRRLARLLALATQKFIADIAANAYQYSRIRSTNTTSNNPLTGLGGAAGFGVGVGGGDAGGEGGGAAATGKGGKKDSGKAAPLGGPRAGYGGGGAGAGQGRTVLTMEDLGMAVGEYGINVKRSEFYR